MGNLNITQLTTNQDDQETTINDKDNELDLALSDVETILIDNTNARTLTATEWTRNMLFDFADGSPVPTAAIVITVPVTIKGIFTVLNRTSFTLTVAISGQADPVSVRSGASRVMSSDGTNVRSAASESVESGSSVLGGFVPPNFRGARVGKVSDLTGQNFTTITVITKVRLSTNLRIESRVTDGDHSLIIRDQSAVSVVQNIARASEAFGSMGPQIVSGVIDVTPGDWFEVTFQVTGDTTLDIDAGLSYFAMEIVESTDNADFTAQVVAVNGRFNGATVSNAADLTTQNFSAGAVITWDTDDIDSDSFHDTGSNQERLTVPSGVTKVRLGANVRISPLTAGDDWSMRIRKNAADFPGGAEAAGLTVNTVAEGSVVSPVVEVIAGDFFDVFVDTETDTDVTVDALASAFWIEVVETSGASDVPAAFIAVQPEFRGVLVKTNTAQSIAAATDVEVEFDSAVYDTKFRPTTGVAQRMWLGVDFTFVDADVSVGNDTVTEVGHGFTTGEGPVRLTNSGGALPAGLAVATDYWIIVDDVDTIRFALSRANAILGTDVDITAAAGAGTHTVETETWVVVPAGVSKVKFTGHASLTGSTGDAVLTLHKNGAIVDGGFQTDDSGTTDADQLTATSAVIEVAEGDRFELVVNAAAGTVTLATGVLDTYMSMEIVDSSQTLAFPGIPVALPHKGALVTNSTNTTNINGGAVLAWDTESYDTNDFHDNVTNNSRFTVPVGVTRVRLTVQITMTAFSVTSELFVNMRINGGNMAPRVVGTFKDDSTGGFSNRSYHLDSYVVDVVEGDFFEINVDNSSATNDDILATETWFTIEVVEEEVATAAPEPIETVLLADSAALLINRIGFKKVATRRFSLHNNFADSQAHAETAPTVTSQIFDVNRNGSTIGTITFAIGSQTATFATTGAVQEDFEIGDQLTIETNGTVNTVIRDVTVALWAFRT